MGSVVAPLVSIVAGAVLGVTTLMGVISSQTGAPDQSPANAEAPALEYGTVNGFTVKKMAAGEGVRWTSGVAVRS